MKKHYNMRGVPRRTLSELNFIIKHHPNMANVYVEGPYDKAVVSWVVTSYGMRNVAFYTIDSIEIPDGEVIARRAKANNRERLAYLSYLLESWSANRNICIIDADFDHVKGIHEESKTLHVTDYTCMEMYAFTEDIISKYLHLCCYIDDCPIANMMSCLATVLQEIFLKAEKQLPLWRLSALCLHPPRPRFP